MNTPACAPPATSDRWVALAFLTFSALTSVIDTSVMTVVTPTLAHSFHASLEAVEWTTSSYALVFGATMLLWGKLGAMLGHQHMSLSFSHFVARQIWRRRGVSPRRCRAHRLQRRVPLRGLQCPWTLSSTFYKLLQIERMEILPAGNALVLAWSNVSPTPKFNVPDRTVTRSTAGCQCGRTLVCAGNFTRKVKGTASVMGPSMTAILVPAGREATSVHCRLSGVNMLGPLCCAAPEETMTRKVKATKVENHVMYRTRMMHPFS
jgi:hypothetical protein